MVRESKPKLITVPAEFHFGPSRKVKVQPGLKTIWCDEAGFTGNNLLDHTQPYFAYSAVAMEPEEAQEEVDLLIRSRTMQGKEIKSSSLLQNAKGRALLLELLERISGRYAVSLAEKKFALAGKFFEYIFEPILAENSKFFYDLHFQKFIANVLYLHFVSGLASAEEILLDFQKFMRERDKEALSSLFSPIAPTGGFDEVISNILDVLHGYPTAIKEEIESLKTSDAIGKWVLDLTDTSLLDLLSYWGMRHEQLDVYCDQSKPLQANRQFMDSMVDRKERIFINYGGEMKPITFNIKQLPQFVDSKDHAGIQLADLVAGAAIYGLKNQKGDGKPFLDEVAKNASSNWIFSDMDFIDLDHEGPFLNACLLMELARRAREDENPLEDIAEYYHFIKWSYHINPPPGIPRRSQKPRRRVK